MVRVCQLNNELLDAEFEGQEIRKTEFFAFYNLDMKKDKHLLDDFGTMKQWKQKMLRPGTYGDAVFLRLASLYLKIV